MNAALFPGRRLPGLAALIVKRQPMNETQQLNYTMNFLALRLGFVVEVATVIVAVIAARRHKLGGLWFLAAASAALALRETANVPLALSFIAHHEKVMVWWISLQYVPFLAAVVALCGWCVLAFSRGKGERPNA